MAAAQRRAGQGTSPRRWGGGGGFWASPGGGPHMKPPSFDYVAPRALDEAIASLARHGDSAKVLAGGQSLVPMLNLRLAGPAVLVDINGVQELAGLSAWNGGLAIGAPAGPRG